jgi:amino acid transporter
MEGHIRRDIGPVALLMTGISSIIGAAWLFGAWHTAQLAGAGAVYAWIVGALIISLIATIFVELGAMFPEAGGMGRYGYYSHGSIVGFVAGWANWISMVSVITLEAEASAQYVASWPFPWARSIFDGRELSRSGLLLAAVLIVAYFLLNYWGVRFYAKTNKWITVFKLAVPALTACALIAAGFDGGNFQVGIHSLHEPANWAITLSAVATSGIVFSFNGFQNPINFAGEAQNPAKNVPLAVFGSIIIATVIYVVLQIAFIGATPRGMLQHGWAAVSFSSPFAQLALALNLNWLALLLYSDAFVSPSGTGATFTAATSRMIYAMARSRSLPKIFGHIDATSGVPRPAMWLNLVAAFLFLYFYRGWGSLGAVISVATIISYLIGPVSVVTFRRTAPLRHRPVKLPLLDVFAPLAFVLATLLLYWARWPLTGEVVLLILAAAPIYIWSGFKFGWSGFKQHLRGAWWLITYLPAVALLSALGSSQFGGMGLLPLGWDQAIVAALGLGFYAWGCRSGWSTPALGAWALEGD